MTAIFTNRAPDAPRHTSRYTPHHSDSTSAWGTANHSADSNNSTGSSYSANSSYSPDPASTDNTSNPAATDHPGSPDLSHPTTNQLRLRLLIESGTNPARRVDATLLTHLPAHELIPELISALMADTIISDEPPATPWRLVTVTGTEVSGELTLADMDLYPGAMLVVTTQPWSGPDLSTHTAEALAKAEDDTAAGRAFERALGPAVAILFAATAIIGPPAGLPALPWWTLVMLALLVSGLALASAHWDTRDTWDTRDARGIPDTRDTSTTWHPRSSFLPEAASLWIAASWRTTNAAGLHHANGWLAIAAACVLIAAVALAALLVADRAGSLRSTFLPTVCLSAATLLSVPSVLTLFRELSLATIAAMWLLLAFILCSFAAPLALRLAGLRPDPVPSTGSELAEVDVPATADRPRRIARSREFHAGVSAGCGVAMVAGAATLALGAPGLSSVLLIAVVAVAEGLRARLQARPTPRAVARTTAGIVGGFAALAAAGADPHWGAGSIVYPGCAALVALIVVALPALPGGQSGRGWRAKDPTTQKAVEVLEAVLTAAAIPLSMWVSGVFAFVRGLG